ncbi:MAG: hypothetical protein V3V61_01045 [Gammaproteobacteria bacterium]
MDKDITETLIEGISNDVEYIIGKTITLDFLHDHPNGNKIDTDNMVQLIRHASISIRKYLCELKENLGVKDGS